MKRNWQNEAEQTTMIRKLKEMKEIKCLYTFNNVVGILQRLRCKQGWTFAKINEEKEALRSEKLGRVFCLVMSEVEFMFEEA